ncbi:MAG: AprI/Inh family metalloprotease inhibitor [Hyphomicrobiales bacterium]|nr:AprI/Inh family metalloprotease inhibitor [Hyphomicrobiales bacterium]
MATRKSFPLAILAAGLLAATSGAAISTPLSDKAANLPVASHVLPDRTPAAGSGNDQRLQLAQVDRRKRRRPRRSSRRSRAGGSASGASSSGIAGRYAVLRTKNRDAGCLLSLNRSGRALVGPGCADQGIQIFDPVRWAYSGGKIVLRARKGHRISFAIQPDGTWQRAPAGKKALGLKKY